MAVVGRLANQIRAGSTEAAVSRECLLRYCAKEFFIRRQQSQGKKNQSSSGISLKQLEEMLGGFETLKKLQIDSKLKDAGEDFKRGLDLSSGKNLTVSVEGNIGSGKTTLLEYYKNSYSVQALREPVEQWTNIQGHNALDEKLGADHLVMVENVGLLYEDPCRWSFSFNMYAQLTRVQMHTKPHTKPIKMLERSLYSTRYCFVENNYRSKTINGLEYAILTEWFDWLIKSQKADLDLIVYLRADPDVCMERIRKRSRKEETCVPRSLIDDLHTLHEDWLVEQTLGVLPAPVLILDANCGYEKMKTLYEDKRQEILCGHV